MDWGLFGIAAGGVIYLISTAGFWTTGRFWLGLMYASYAMGALASFMVAMGRK